MRSFPFELSSLDPYYEKLKKIIGIHGENDCLKEYFQDEIEKLYLKNQVFEDFFEDTLESKEILQT